MKSKFILSLIIISVMISCKKNENITIDTGEAAVVSVNGQTLYLADIRAIVPLGLTAEDSAQIAQSYIQKWINDELLYAKAKENIIDQKEINELVENYKKSLIINSYQENLLKQYFSSHVSENEIKTYFEQNKSQFKLKDNIIKGLYLKVPLKSPQLDNFKKWYTQTNDEAIGNIEKNALQNVVGYQYFYNKWLNFSDLMDNIPYIVADAEQFLKTNKNIQIQDSSFVYLLNIKEYKLTGGEAPFDYARDNLNQIFKEKKKEIFTKQLEKDLYEKAQSKNEIKFLLK